MQEGSDGTADVPTEEARVYEFDLVLPTTVDVREVGMRDGLQLEAPVPLEAKLEMLEALVATGVRRIDPIIPWQSFKPRYMAPAMSLMVVGASVFVTDIVQRTWAKLTRAKLDRFQRTSRARQANGRSSCVCSSMRACTGRSVASCVGIR